MIPKTSLRTRPSSAGFPGKVATSTGLGMQQSDCRYPVCWFTFRSQKRRAWLPHSEKGLAE